MEPVADQVVYHVPEALTYSTSDRDGVAVSMHFDAGEVSVGVGSEEHYVLEYVLMRDGFATRVETKESSE